MVLTLQMLLNPPSENLHNPQSRFSITTTRRSHLPIGTSADLPRRALLTSSRKPHVSPFVISGQLPPSERSQLNRIPYSSRKTTPKYLPSPRKIRKVRGPPTKFPTFTFVKTFPAAEFIFRNTNGSAYLLMKAIFSFIISRGVRNNPGTNFDDTRRKLTKLLL